MNHSWLRFMLTRVNYLVGIRRKRCLAAFFEKISRWASVYQNKQTIFRASTVVIRINFVLFHMCCRLGLMNYFMIIFSSHPSTPFPCSRRSHSPHDIKIKWIVWHFSYFFVCVSHNSWVVRRPKKEMNMILIPECCDVPFDESSWFFFFFKRWWWWMAKNSLNRIYSIESWPHLFMKAQENIKRLNEEIKFEFLRHKINCHSESVVNFPRAIKDDKTSPDGWWIGNHFSIP